MYLTIYKIARNKVKINTDQYWIQKKKKKRSYQRRKLLHVSIISETIDICIRLNICNFATGVIQRCYKCTTAGVQQGTGRKRGSLSPYLRFNESLRKWCFQIYTLRHVIDRILRLACTHAQTQAQTHARRMAALKPQGVRTPRIDNILLSIG